MKATNMLPTQRTTYQEMREAQAVRRERESTRAMFTEDKKNARISEVMARCREDEMKHATFILSVMHHVDAGKPIYVFFVAACEAEGVDWREIIRYPGQCASRHTRTIVRRQAVVVRMRERNGMSFPEIGEVLNTSTSAARTAYERYKREGAAA